MKTKILFATLLTGFLATVAFAQKPDVATPASKTGQKTQMKPEDKALKESNKAEKELALNAEQKAKWQAAALTRINANQPLIEKMQGSTTPEERKQLKSQIRTNGQTFDQTVSAMLTTEQQSKWQTWKGNKKKAMNKKMKQKKWSEDEFED